jgi:hypothetical protein
MAIQWLTVKYRRGWRNPPASPIAASISTLNEQAAADQNPQFPNTTACMMRPGANVKMPAMTSAPVKIAIIAWRCRSTR